jgi:hypothetical protein
MADWSSIGGKGGFLRRRWSRSHPALGYSRRERPEGRGKELIDALQKISL